MKILGVDPALKITGFGIIEKKGNDFSWVASGTISTSANKPMPERLNKIHTEMSGLIKKYEPQVLVLEKIFVHYQHPATAFLLGQARGVICLCCAQANIPMAEYAATQVKKSLIGKGLASKDQVQRMVVSLLGLKSVPRYNDETDALALAIAHSYFQKFQSFKL